MLSGFIQVYWIAPENLTDELHLGQFDMAYIGIAAGHGRIKQQTEFQIINEPGFARFTECEFWKPSSSSRSNSDLNPFHSRSHHAGGVYLEAEEHRGSSESVRVP